jgi:hypothetical protein
LKRLAVLTGCFRHQGLGCGFMADTSKGQITVSTSKLGTHLAFYGFYLVRRQPFAAQPAQRSEPC